MQLQVLSRFGTIGEAESARTALDAAGIDAEIVDEEMVVVNWMISNAIGGVKLLVRDSDLAESKEILSTAALPLADENAGGTVVDQRALGAPPPNASDTVEERCPRCGLPELHRIRHRRLIALSMFEPVFALVLPLVFSFLPKRECDACGYRA